MNLLKARIGGTLYIYNESNQKEVVDKLLRKSKRTGEAIHFPNAKVWFTKDPIVDTSKSGSSQYIWAKDGNRVKCQVIKHTLRGIIHQTEEMGTCYNDLD